MLPPFPLPFPLHPPRYAHTHAHECDTPETNRALARTGNATELRTSEEAMAGELEKCKSLVRSSQAQIELLERESQVGVCVCVFVCAFACACVCWCLQDIGTEHRRHVIEKRALLTDRQKSPTD